MAKKKARGAKSDNRLTKKEMINRVIHLFNACPKEAMNYKQVSAEIGATSQVNKLMVAGILNDLAEEEYLAEIDRGKYKLNGLGTLAVGKFERRSNGKNSFLPEDGGNPLFVAERNSMHAMNGDKVKVQILAKRKGRTPEAEVIEIIERYRTSIVGIIEIGKYQAFLLTDSKILANDIFIPKDKLKGAKDGQKALVKIIEWPDKANNPIGEVIDVLGDVGNNQTEMHAILAEFGLPYKYPENVEKAAAKIPTKITNEDIRLREDFRDVTTFTIDPKDAKDFDDALSIRKLKNGNWEVGIHIADVTHYVKAGSVIDKEAAQRGTSVYLVDRTIPMLPESLSNGLCSLRPNEDKLCYSVIFELTDSAEVKKHRIVKTIINSNRRFSYEEAQEIIETDLLSEDKQSGDPMNDVILTLDRLAKILRKKRFKDGAINFDRYEVKFDIDENGKPLRVFFKEAKDSNKLIEEFMLLANRSVAEFIGKVPHGKKAKTFVYRVHDLPNPEKLTNFAEFIRRFGYKLKDKGKDADISKSINQLLDDVQGKKEQTMIETLAIRSMAKATYTTQNIGHYGLAFKYYTHFTSPIRRYPDMMVHRLLERYLSGGRSVNEAQTEDDCKHSSDMESLATSAERTSIKYKQVEFMSEKIGMVFDGVISGVTEWGIYVELSENGCEGMVPIRDLVDDYYEFDEKTYSLIGKRKKQRYSLGQPLRIKVARANLERRQLDFALWNE
ncbi:MAG: ribonuclease R [Dysgonamonadaceae bacterium]|jgi:ribonuclease R|nr:ribonuclease R [Dysgonamonadaceae bacterium]